MGDDWMGDDWLGADGLGENWLGDDGLGDDGLGDDGLGDDWQGHPYDPSAYPTDPSTIDTRTGPHRKAVAAGLGSIVPIPPPIIPRLYKADTSHREDKPESCHYSWCEGLIRKLRVFFRQFYGFFKGVLLFNLNVSS